MLSRTAENLFWMGRYMERADATARLIEMGYRMAMLPGSNEQEEWRSVAAASGSAPELADPEAKTLSASAVVQRLVRPLLGSQPSVLGPVLGAVFFGAVGAAIGLVTSYLLVTATPEPFRGLRNSILGDWTTTDPRALAITGALVVAMAVPFAAVGAGIGGPVSAEVEDSRAVESSASAASAGATLNPRAAN